MDLADQAAALPQGAGVYLFRDRDGAVLYVGKAINLRARVAQYLSGHDERFMVRYLVAAARSVEGLAVRNEKEALLLENSLIKEHQPRYNVKLRDDKDFLRLRIDPRARFPRLTTARRTADDGARYFGPYPSATQARGTLAFVQRHFKLRTCSDAVLDSRRRPCLLYQLQRCTAPCVGLVTPEAYAEQVDDAALSLAGRNRELIPRLEARMVEHADHERFEAAARLRDLVTTLRKSTERQAVADLAAASSDAWGLHREADRGVVAMLPAREGMVQSPRTFPFEGEIVDDAALLSSVLNAWYGDHEVPAQVLLPVELPDAHALADILREQNRRVRLLVPRRGDKAAGTELAASAARARFASLHSEADRVGRALATVAEVCGLDGPPWRIECFDNSNLLGQEPVASQVVFIDGRPSRKDYRRYHVKSVVGADDYATMREIIGRRMRRAAEEGEFPDLVVVDGGRGQLGAAIDALRELGLDDQPIIGLAKPRTEHARGERDAVDKIIVPGRPEPIILRHDDPGLRLLQHLRDQAHETAIGFHRKTRSKARMRSQLDDIPGIGKARRLALLRHFGSLTALRAAEVGEIAAVEGLGPKVAERIFAALHRRDGESR
ncbi:MAG: excinuclease ABC subunit UvrC [Deltaproteobacteria bacterium]|nr:excinuclease ABC subunit UvrC [Deltaproteobacteria bacterium]